MVQNTSTERRAAGGDCPRSGGSVKKMRPYWRRNSRVPVNPTELPGFPAANGESPRWKGKAGL